MESSGQKLICCSLIISILSIATGFKVRVRIEQVELLCGVKFALIDMSMTSEANMTEIKCDSAIRARVGQSFLRSA